jgi:hypothetical protein
MGYGPSVAAVLAKVQNEADPVTNAAANDWRYADGKDQSARPSESYEDRALICRTL